MTILILSHVFVVVVPVSLLPIPIMIMRVLTELIYWLHSQIVGGRGQIMHGDVSSP